MCTLLCTLWPRLQTSPPSLALTLTPTLALALALALALTLTLALALALTLTTCPTTRNARSMALPEP